MSNYTIWGVFGPATWPWWFAVLALLCGLFGPRGNRPRRWFLSAAVALVLLLAVLPTGYWLTETLEQRFPPPSQVDGEIAHIVVLAGAERLAAAARSGRPEYGSAAERVIEAVVLARRFPRSDLWIIGGVTDRRSPAADVDWSAMTWRELGVSPTRIRKVDDTRDTCANAEGFAARHAQGKILLVTSAIHMPRSIACFRAHGVAPIPYPVDFQNEAITSWRDLVSPNLLANLARADAAIHEWIGLGYYRLRGRTRAWLPAP